MRRRIPWVRMLVVVGGVLLCAALLLLFPPPLAGARVDPAWQPGCPEVTTAWNELPPQRPTFWTAPLQSSNGLLEARSHDPNQNWNNADLLLTTADGQHHQSGHVKGHVYGGLHDGDQVYLVADNGSSKFPLKPNNPPPIQFELAVLDADDFKAEHRFSISIAESMLMPEARLWRMSDGRILVLIHGLFSRGKPHALTFDPVTSRLSDPLMLPDNFLPDASTRLLPGDRLVGTRILRNERRGFMHDLAHGGTIVVDPLTGDERPEWQLHPYDAQGKGFQRVRHAGMAVEEMLGHHLWTQVMQLEHPPVGVAIQQSRNRRVQGGSQKPGRLQQAVQLRHDLWQLGMEKIPGFPDFGRWSYPIESVELVQAIPWGPNADVNATSKTVHLEEVTTSAAWTAAARRYGGLHLHAYTDDRALLTQVVYPTPSTINRGRGLLRFGVIDPAGPSLTWSGWAPLPDGYRKPAHVTTVVVAAMPDGLLVKLEAAKWGRTESQSVSTIWTCVVPYPANEPRPQVGILKPAPQMG